MSLEIESDDKMLTFKRSISLTDFSKGMKHFNALYKLFGGRDAQYTEFTKWLMDSDFVDAGLSINEVNELMKKAEAKK